MKMPRIDQLPEPANVPTFAATVDAAAPFLPGTSAGPIQKDGIVQFYDAVTDEPVSLDTNNLMGEGETDSNTVMVTGKRRWGKTTLGMHFATLLGGRKAVDDYPFHIMANIHRRNAGVSEMARLVEKFGCKLLPLQSYGLNIFIKGMLDLEQTLDMASDTFELIRKDDLSPAEYEALSVALFMMLGEEFEDVSSPTCLSFILNRMNKGDVFRYRESVEEAFLHRYPDHKGIQRLLARDNKIHPQRADLADVEDVVHAARTVAKLARRLAAKKCIGDENSLAGAMEQRFFAPDFTGMTDQDLVIIQAYIWRVKMMGIINDDPLRYFNLELHDENYKLWKYLAYARAQSEFLKAIRGTRTTVVEMTHRYRDYTTVGPASSEQYMLATNHLDDISIHVLGRQPESAREEVRSRLELSNTEFNLCKRMPFGTWGLVILGQPFRHVRMEITSGVREVSASDAANDSMIV